MELRASAARTGRARAGPAAPGVHRAERTCPGTAPSVHRAAFNAVEQALHRFDWMTASVALDAVPALELNPEDSNYRRYLQARIAWQRGEIARARALLARADSAGNSAALRYRIATFRHHMLALGAEHVAGARVAARLMELAPASSTLSWKRHTWRGLQRARTETLRAALASATDPRWAGWLQLALDSRLERAEKPAALRRWLARHPDHPAAGPLPGGMNHLLQRAPGRSKVALLLPLSGSLAPAGRAVLDGYLAAHYARRNDGESPVELLVLDTGTRLAPDAAYAEAVAWGATMVVGPLDKSAVAALATQVQRPVPVLALNRIDRVLPAAGQALVQFSLAPEDEAVQLAEVAFGRGGRAALVLAPAGPWGEKMEQSLRTRWQELGGNIAGTASYTTREDYSSRIKSALGLTASERRAREVRDMLAANIEFTPRRRRDLDTMFLLSSDGEEARSIKPLLAFHYAGGLPVFAPTSVYSGIPDERNRDLNGLLLLEMPWLLGDSSHLRVAIAAGDTGSDSYTRLNALGADAHLLQAQFRRLQSGPDALIRGNTGLLSMDPRLRIRRELSMATFDGGVIRPE
ncbi:MAG: penicillin-binding protein activator [Halioglobus sp.]|nr:penicillin-binding protein activator [Halioglobus sp.]